LNPPASDALWARVEEVRRSKTRGGGPRRSGYVDLLGGLLLCVCGRRLRSAGTFADGRHRKLHPDPCPAWGDKARLAGDTWEAPINVVPRSLTARRMASRTAGWSSMATTRIGGRTISA
jgi:hypothetical protein